MSKLVTPTKESREFEAAFEKPAAPKTYTLPFERTTCTRCGGSGRYSYCQTMNGPHGPWSCFKCGGYGEYRTKRGQAAYDLFERSLSVRAADLEPGMRVKRLGNGRRWETVKRVYQQHAGDYTCASIDKETGERRYGFCVQTTACSYTSNDGADELWRVAWSAVNKTHAYALASEYESLLTKQGKEPKRAKPAARCREIREQLGVA